MDLVRFRIRPLVVRSHKYRAECHKEGESRVNGTVIIASAIVTLLPFPGSLEVADALWRWVSYLQFVTNS